VKIKPLNRNLSHHLLFALGMSLILCVSCTPGKETAPQTSGGAKSETVKVETADGPIEVTVTAKPGEIQIGEVFQYSFRASAKAPIKLLPPAIPDPDSIDPFLIRDLTTPRTEEDSDQELLSGSWTLDTFKIGELSIPPLEIRYISSNAETQSVQSASLPIQVISTLEQNGGLPDIEDIKGPAIPPRAPINYWMWLGIAGAALFLLALIVFLYRRFRKRKKSRPAEPSTPPHQIALQALAQLSENLPERTEEIDPFYVRLSEVVRVYVEQRFGIQAPEQTTEEFLVELEHSSDVLLAPQKQLLRQFLAQSDLVKFARFQPASADIEEAVEQAIAFVKGTIPPVDHSSSTANQEASAA
jgi:hypothetical protein